MAKPAIPIETGRWGCGAKACSGDGLIVVVAASAGCATLLGWDLRHGGARSGVRLENPFLAGNGRRA